MTNYNQKAKLNFISVFIEFIKVAGAAAAMGVFGFAFHINSFIATTTKTDQIQDNEIQSTQSDVQELKKVNAGQSVDITKLKDKVFQNNNNQNQLSSK